MANRENAWISLSGDLKINPLQLGHKHGLPNLAQCHSPRNPELLRSKRDGRGDDRISYLTRSRNKILNFSPANDRESQFATCPRPLWRRGIRADIRNPSLSPTPHGTFEASAEFLELSSLVTTCKRNVWRVLDCHLSLLAPTRI